MTQFNYASEAELFPGRRKVRKPNAIGYRRFARASEAIRFAVEDMPAVLLLGAFLEVDDKRYDGRDIRRLYDSTDYPHSRLAAA
jgi:hypothetical protein